MDRDAVKLFHSRFRVCRYQQCPDSTNSTASSRYSYVKHAVTFCSARNHNYQTCNSMRKKNTGSGSHNLWRVFASVVRHGRQHCSAVNHICSTVQRHGYGKTTSRAQPRKKGGGKHRSTRRAQSLASTNIFNPY